VDILRLPKTLEQRRGSRFPIVDGKTSNSRHAPAFVVDIKGGYDLPVLMEIS